MDPISTTITATNLLKKTGQGENFPVDPVTVALKLGFKVIQSELPVDVSGALYKDKGQDPMMVVQRTDSDGLKRFNIAHMISHYVSVSGAGSGVQTEFKKIDYRASSPASDRVIDNEEEESANEFASDLLMPEKEIKKLKKQKKSEVEMALYFGVPTDVMSSRLKRLNITL